MKQIREMIKTYLYGVLGAKRFLLWRFEVSKLKRKVQNQWRDIVDVIWAPTIIAILIFVVLIEGGCKIKSRLIHTLRPTVQHSNSDYFTRNSFTI